VIGIIEYLVTRDLLSPYKRLINRLIALFEEEMYDRKEKLVQRLQELTGERKSSECLLASSPGAVSGSAFFMSS